MSSILDPKALALEELTLRERHLELVEGLPHLHGWKNYKWMREFIESQNREILLCCANQIGKSSSQIRKVIHWATAQDLWPALWPRKPLQFWYLYPTYQVATIEFKKKWIPEFMPRGKYQDDPVYGWKAEIRNGVVAAVHFNSGVSIYFKTYAMDVQDLQTGSCFQCGTLIVTKRGVLPIEEVAKGDTVLGDQGWNEVQATQVSEQEMISVNFSNGSTLTGTTDHPIYVNGAWVKLGELTGIDTVRTIPGWQTLWSKFTYSKAGSSSEPQNTLISARGITTWITWVVNCMSKFGRQFITGPYRTATLFITSILTHLTIGQKIYNACQKLNTLVYISLRSGALKASGNLHARPVAPSSRQGVRRIWFGVSVLKNAAARAIPKVLSALNAANKKTFEGMRPSVFAQSCVRTLGSGKVYNLRLSGDHTFYANGVLTHNCDYIALDEEAPAEILPELQMRLVAKGGYFSAVFTPTLGQEVWRCAIEEIGKKAETFKGAFKQQVSMYDCLYYTDGTRSPWTLEAIQRAERACKSEAQIQRRVYGRFVSDEGLKYPSFERGRNLIEGDGKPPPDWDIVVGADVGSGGDNHPAAIVFIAVSPDRQKGVVFKGWRGDDCITTAGDVVHKVIQLAAGLKVSRIFYDWASKDFYTIAQSMGLNVEAAEKNHAVGEQVVNVLFKNRMLSVHDLSELEPLCVELTTLKAATPKRNAKDDYCDALRYACTKVDWDWSILNAKPVAEKAKERTEREDRREFVSPTEAVMGEYEGEIEEWNYLYHSSLD